MRLPSKRLEPNLRLKLEGWRSRIVLLLCLGGFAILFGRAFYLQALNNDFLQANLSDTTAAAILRKPFHLADLLRIIDDIFPGRTI